MGSQRIDPVAVDPVTQRQEPWINQITGLLQNVPGQVDTTGLQSPGAVGQAGTSYLTDVLGGKYLNQGNPYMQGMVSSAVRPVEDFYRRESANIASQANQMGQLYGSPRMNLQADLMERTGRQIGDITSNLYGTQYANERALQQGALGYGLQYDMAPLQRLAAIQGLQMTPWQAQLGGLMGLLNATQGQIATPQYYNPMTDFLGSVAPFLV